MEDKRIEKKLLEEFIDYLKYYCGQEVFYAFDETEDAIESFLKFREENNGN